jgi:5-methylcytosine-specific restriction endonuclease McrA
MSSRPYKHVRLQKEIKKLQENMCVICWMVDKKKARGHHVIPYSEDGPSGIGNFITLCDDCHKNYHARKINFDIYVF